MSLPKINAPVYETNLISTGKTIQFRPFLVKEQKLFLMAAESDDAKDVTNAIKQVLNNCIMTENVDIDTLPVFDLEYLFLQLRIRSVGEISKLKYKCNNKIAEEKVCGAIVEIDVDLNSINPTIPKEHSQKIELSKDMGIMMKYPNFSILNKLNIESELDMFKIVVSCIDYIYDKDTIYYSKDYTTAELNDFVDNMSQEDLEKVKNFFSTMPKIEKDLEFKCKKCGYTEQMHVEGIQNFFS